MARKAELLLQTEVALRGLDTLLAAAGPRAPVALARALNRTGSPMVTRTKRIIKQTLGVQQHPYAKYRLNDRLKRKMSVRRAKASKLEFSFAGFGKGLPLIFYQPKEAPVGASFNWLGSRRTIARSFFLSGQFPKRKRSSISHTVWQRLGKGHQSYKERARDPYGRANLGQPIGPSVAEAMRSPAVANDWESQAAARLPHHLRSALESLLAGHFKSR